MKPIGSDNNASTSNTDMTMDGSASDKIPTSNAIATNSANQCNTLIFRLGTQINLIGFVIGR